MTFIELLKNSFNPKSGIASSKRITLLLSQVSLYLESLIVMIFYIIIPFYYGLKITDSQMLAMVPVIITVFTSHLLIVLWALKGIQNVDIAYAQVLQQSKVEPGAGVVTDGDQTVIQADDIQTENIENVNTETVNQNDKEINPPGGLRLD